MQDVDDFTGGLALVDLLRRHFERIILEQTEGAEGVSRLLAGRSELWSLAVANVDQLAFTWAASEGRRVWSRRRPALGRVQSASEMPGLSRPPGRQAAQTP